MNGGLLGWLSEFHLDPIILRIVFEKDAGATVLDCRKLIRDKPGIDAILFTANYLALARIKAIHELGLTIPYDILVIAFDDHDVFPMSNTLIRAIVQALQQISRPLFLTLLSRLDSHGDSHEISLVLIKPELTLRGATVESSQRRLC